VDAASVGTIYTEVGMSRMPFEAIVQYVIAYNLLAFGLQPPVGWVVDRPWAGWSTACGPIDRLL
jgi:hypothetical protein